MWVYSLIKYFIVLCVIIGGFCGFYFAGYQNGKKETKIEYITKEVEVEKIKYVEKEKSQVKREKIYSKPSAGKSDVVKWLRTAGKN